MSARPTSSGGRTLGRSATLLRNPVDAGGASAGGGPQGSLPPDMKPPDMKSASSARTLLHAMGGVMVLAAAFWWAGPLASLVLLIVSNRLGWRLLPIGNRSGQRVAALLAHHDMLPSPVRQKHSQDIEDAGVRVGVCAMQGWRRAMEDAHTALLRLSPEHPGFRFFGVYDGHCGPAVSQWAAERLHTFVEQSPHFAAGEYARALRDGALAADRALRAEMAPLLPKPPVRPGGSTAVAALLTPTGEVLCANIGDSRCVLCRGGGALALSEDHKPQLPDEEQRIRSAGGFVRMNRVQGQLAMSRALGDFQFKGRPDLPQEQQMVSAAPELRSAQVGAEDEFLILACDGVWDCASNDEAVAFVRRRLTRRPPPKLSAVCAELFDSIIARMPHGIGCDNMSMIIVEFKHPAGAGARRASSPERAAGAAAGAGGAGGDPTAE